MVLKSGKLLKNGEYRIERVLGKGGFGITYLAYQISLSRRVAIKEFFMSDFCNRDADTSHVSVPSVGSKDVVEKFKRKFIKEARNIASLNNPHIIRIYDIFEDNGTAYYVMEYHDGGSLQGLIDRCGRLSESEALSFIRQIADALQYIHKRNMNHLDVKPGNVLLDDEGNAVLIDFGLSKRYDTEGNQTSTTPVGISHGYAPFEQYQHGGVSTFSPATDIYSLGATFYKLVTGITPPNATVVGEDGLPPYPSPVSLSTSSAIEKSMQLLRRDRPQSIAEFLALLASPSSASTETLIAEEAGESTVFPENEKPEKQAVEVKVSQLEDGKKKRSSWIFVLLAVLLIAGIGEGLYVFFSGNGNTSNVSFSDSVVALSDLDSVAILFDPDSIEPLITGDIGVEQTPVAVVSTELMNMYLGCQNPINIRVPNVNDDEVKVSMTSGTLIKKTNGDYIAVPSKIGETTFTITVQNEERILEVGKFKFNVRKLPDPTIYIDCKDENGNSCSFRGEAPILKSQLMNSKGLGLMMVDGLPNATFKVVGFETTFFDSMGNSFFEVSNSAEFTKKQCELISGLSRGKRFYISKVRVVGPDKIEHTLLGAIPVIVKG